MIQISDCRHEHLVLYEARTGGHHFGWWLTITKHLLSADVRRSLAAGLHPKVKRKI